MSEKYENTIWQPMKTLCFLQNNKYYGFRKKIKDFSLWNNICNEPLAVLWGPWKLNN